MQQVPLRLAPCVRTVFSAPGAQFKCQIRARWIERNCASGNSRDLRFSGQLRHARTRYYGQEALGGVGNKASIPVPPAHGQDTSDASSSPSIVSDHSSVSEHSSSPTTSSQSTPSSTEAQIPFPPLPDEGELPSANEARRTRLSRRMSHLMDNLQSNIFTASQRLNDLTGYSGIEILKKKIDKQEQLVSDTRRGVKQARSAYSAAVATRSATQREVNDLLQRKQSWSATDLERFTALYRSDHANEQAEQRSQDELARRERDAEEAGNTLAKSILARYHEEQIWSDKIRQMSTWGTWGLMGVNVLLFLIFQVAVEPWRRRRLVKGFEEKVKEALERETVESGLESTSSTLANTSTVENDTAQSQLASNDDAATAADTDTTTSIQVPTASTTTTATTTSPSSAPNNPPPFSDPSSFSSSPLNHLYHQDATASSLTTSIIQDPLSDTKTLSMTHREATILYVQAAAAGGIAVGMTVTLVMRLLRA